MAGDADPIHVLSNNLNSVLKCVSIKKKSKKQNTKYKKQKVARDKVFQDEYCKCPLSCWAIYHRTLYFNDYLVTWFPFVPYVSFPHWTSSRAVSTSEVLGPP